MKVFLYWYPGTKWEGLELILGINQRSGAYDLRGSSQLLHFDVRVGAGVEAAAQAGSRGLVRNLNTSRPDCGGYGLGAHRGLQLRLL
jgi:hypothetical protein